MLPLQKSSGAQTRFENDRRMAAQVSLAGQVQPLAQNMPKRKRLVPGLKTASKLQLPNPNGVRSSNLNAVFQALASNNLPYQFEEDFEDFRSPDGNGFDVNSFKNNVELDQFLNSPQLKEALTRSKLSDYFQSLGSF
jgi:hypothetical protein